MAVGLPVRVALDEALALAPAVSDGVGVPVGLADRELVEVALALASTLPLALLACAVVEAVGSEVAEPEREMLPVFEAEAPTESKGAGLGEAGGLTDSVGEPAGVTVPEPHAWEAGLGGAKEVPLLGRELLPAPDTLLAPEAEAFTAPEKVERAEGVHVELPAGEGAPVPEELSLPEVGGGESVKEDSVGLGLAVELSDGVAVRVKPGDAGERGEKVGTGPLLLLGLAVPLEAAEAEGKAAGLGVGVGEGVALAVTLAVALSEEVRGRVGAAGAGERGGVALAVAPTDAEGEGEAVPLGVPLGEEDTVPLPLCKPPAALLALGVSEAVGVGVPSGESLPLAGCDCVGVPETDAVGLGVPLPESVLLPLPVAVGVGTGVGAPLAVRVAERVALAVGLAVGEAVLLGLGEPLPEGVPLALPVAVGVAVKVALAVGLALPVAVGVTVKVALAVGLGVGEAGQALKGAAQAPRPPGAMTLTLAYTESATKSRPLQSTARPRGLAMSAAVEGPPSPKSPGQGGRTPAVPITVPKNVPLGNTLSTLFPFASAMKSEPQASTARAGTEKKRLPEVARVPAKGVEVPGTPVPARVRMMRVEVFTARTRANSPM